MDLRKSLILDMTLIRERVYGPKKIIDTGYNLYQMNQIAGIHIYGPIKVLDTGYLAPRAGIWQSWRWSCTQPSTQTRQRTATTHSILKVIKEGNCTGICTYI